MASSSSSAWDAPGGGDFPPRSAEGKADSPANSDRRLCAAFAHRWGYEILELVQILKARDRDRAAEGKPPGVYWFDNCVLNQHKFAKLDWNDPEQRRASIDALQYSVGACGTVLLCCTTGPTEAAGWESPAPFARVWCVFEIYVAITKDAGSREISLWEARVRTRDSGRTGPRPARCIGPRGRASSRNEHSGATT